MRRLVAGLVLTALAAAACGGGSAPNQGALVVVSAPLTAEPWVGRFLQRGAELAAAALHGKVRLEVLDNGGSAQTVAAHARRAVAEGASALVVDGVGAEAVAAVSGPARLPVFVTFEGGASVIDPKGRPTVFRLAPADVDLTRRLADYLADTRRGEPVALVADDTSYGREGGAAVRAALQHDDVRITSDQVVPQGASDVSAQVLAARRSGARLLVVWARAAGVAAVVRAARSTGWPVEVWTGPAGEDPLVRQQLADHPSWVEGLGFVSFRITSETGGAPFATYRAAYEKRFGAEQVGVRAGGRPVVQPPDWSALTYDAVTLVAAAIERAGGPDRAKVLQALEQVSITGANGDERGYGPGDREGVSPDDMYFAVFHDQRFAPVHDDKLSTNLPVVAQ